MTRARLYTISMVAPALLLLLSTLASGCGDPRAAHAAVPADAPADAPAVEASSSEDADRAARLDLRAREFELERREVELERRERALQAEDLAAETVADRAVPAANPAPVPPVGTEPSDPADLDAPPGDVSESVDGFPVRPRRIDDVDVVDGVDGTDRDDAFVSLSLPADAVVPVVLLDTVSSRESVSGDVVRAEIAEDVPAGAGVIPAKSRLLGEVVEVGEGRRIGGRETVTVRFASLELPDGDRAPIDATLEVAGRKQTKKDAVTIGGSAVAGALLGRILKDDDRDEGALVGAVVGAAAGTAAASRNGRDAATLEAGQPAEVTLLAAFETVSPAALHARID